MRQKALKNDQYPETHLRILSESYSMNTKMTGAFCAFDESSLSIGRVNIEQFRVDKFPCVLLTPRPVIEVFALFHKYFSQYPAIGYDQGRPRPEINPENLPILFDPELFGVERAEFPQLLPKTKDGCNNTKCNNLHQI